MGIDNQAGDLVCLVRDHLFVEKVSQRQVGQGKLRRHALLGRPGGEAGQHISAAQGRGPGQQRTQIVKLVADVADGVGEGHAVGTSVSEICRNRGEEKLKARKRGDRRGPRGAFGNNQLLRSAAGAIELRGVRLHLFVAAERSEHGGEDGG